jgi:RND family efflux transporter MFP subunit
MSKKLITSIVISLAVIGSGVFFYMSSGNGYETFMVEKGDLVDSTTLVGTVKANRDLDLGFEVTGRVADVLVTENQIVNAGDVLIELNKNDLFAQRTQAIANLNEARSSLEQQKQQVLLEEARLEDLLSGSSAEEIKVAERNVELRNEEVKKAMNVLEEAEKNYESEVQNLLDESKSTLSGSLNQALSSLYSLTDLQFEIHPQEDNDSILVGFYKANAVEQLVGLSGAKRFRNNIISEARGGLVEEINNLKYDSLDEAYEFSFKITSALQEINNAYASFVLDDDVEQSSIDLIASQKSIVSGELASLSSFRNLINTTNRSNLESIRLKESDVIVAERALDQTKAELDRVKVGPTDTERSIQEIAVEQAKSLVASREARVMFENGRVAGINAEIAKKILTSPISGSVVDLNISTGEIVGASQEVITIQAEDDLLVEIDVPERYLSKLQIGAEVAIRLDAYPSESFKGKVIRIDQESTLVDNVPIFKVDLSIEALEYEVRAGMTGDVEIILTKVEDVLRVPKRLVMDDENGKYVNLIIDQNSFESEKVYVETGMESSDAMIEIKSGLKEGDVILDNQEI